MDWMVEISGDTCDLETLTQSFNTNELTIKKDDDKYVLTSQSFKQYDESEIVYEKAQEIINLLNGITHLEDRLTGVLKIKSVFIKQGNGKRVLFLFAESPLKIGGSASVTELTHSDGSKEKFHPDNPVRKWLPLAIKDENVKKVFLLFDRSPSSWSNLYNIFEIIEFDVGKGFITSEGWASKKTIKLFKYTANTPTGLDLDKRHPATHKQPPPEPMTIDKAKALIKSIILRWLQNKLHKMNS